MPIEATRLLAWHELPAKHWLRLVDDPLSTADMKEIPWPIEESVLRRIARKHGMLLERLSPDRYRLWDIREQVSGRDDPVPVDLTAGEEFVDSLAGIAYFLSL
jgi:hypothetical protein